MIKIQAKEKSSVHVKKKRIPQTIEHLVDKQSMKLHATKAFWQTAFKMHLDYELIPHLYRYITSSGFSKKESILVFTNGSMFMHCKIQQNTILLYKVYRRISVMKQKEIEEKNYILLQPTLALWMDKHFHFFKRYAKRKFNLTLIVPAYFKAKGMMPNDRVITTDGESTVILAKKDSATIVLVSGMKNGEIDWDEYLDTKMIH